jgi:hypothetical protein
MAEGSLYFSVLEFQGVQERESVQPSRGRAACAAEEAGAIAFARLRAGSMRGEEGVEAYTLAYIYGFSVCNVYLDARFFYLRDP